MARQQPEAALQEACCELLAIWERQGKLAFYAVPNGGKRNPREAARLKDQGVRAGVPDLAVLIPGGKSIYLELKAAKNKLQPSQETWKLWLESFGFGYALIRSVDDMKAVLKPHISRGKLHEQGLVVP